MFRLYRNNLMASSEKVDRQRFESGVRLKRYIKVSNICLPIRKDDGIIMT